MKKGFTLIELLAVIVVLAIIALIATPIVLDIIEDSKKSSNIRSTEMYLSSFENYIAQQQLNNNVLDDGTYSVKQISEMNFKIDGKIPTNGYIKVQNNEVIDYVLIMDNNVINKGSTSTSFDKWYGSISEITPDEKGVYHITQASELAWIAQQINSGNLDSTVNISLENNIDLNNIEWTPIGTSEYPFKGNFEGNNHVINNLYINRESEAYSGLFGKIYNESEEHIVIKNVKIGNIDIKSANYTGAIAGHVVGYVNLSNIVIFDGNIESNSRHVGGIGGCFEIGGNIENIDILKLNLSGTRLIGAIAGAVYNISEDSSSVANVKNCYIDSDTNLTATGETTGNFFASSIGSISGDTWYGGTISDITTYATLNAEGTHVGGLVGQLRKDSVVENIKVYSTINAVNSPNLVGGIIGASQTSGSIITVTNFIASVKIFTSSTITDIGVLTSASYNPTVYFSDGIIESTINNNKVTENDLINATDRDNIQLSNVTIK